MRALRGAAPRILQAGLAAGAAWLVARELFGHPQPYFAPIAAVLTLGLTFERRGVRAWELALGVALGIGIADLMVRVTGTGTWQLVLVVCAAMSLAVLAGGGALLVNQAAVSAVLVTTLEVPDGPFEAARFVDALVGAGVGLAVNAIAPVNPVRLVLRRSDPLLAGLAGATVDVADALGAGDRGAAELALERARALDPAVRELRAAVGIGRETTQLAPSRRRSRGRVEVLGEATEAIDHAVRNTRVLARSAIRAIELDENVPDVVVDSVRDLGAAAAALADHLERPAPDSPAVGAALRAAALASAALEQTSNMAVSVIVGQVRATATDLLLALGLSREEAVERVRGAREEMGV